jgi:hypothetical protein
MRLNRTLSCRHRRIGVGAARRAETSRERNRFQIRLTKSAAHLFFADKNLEHPGNGERITSAQNVAHDIASA